MNMNKNWFTFSKETLIQLISTIIAFFLMVLLPVISYIQLIPYFSDSQNISILNFKYQYDIFTVFSILFGSMATVSRYLIYNYEKNSISRGILNLVYSVIILIQISLLLIFRTITIFDLNSFIILDLSSFFIVIIILWSLYVFRNVFDLIDFTFNRKIFQKEARKFRKFNPLVKCPKCGYMCYKNWGKCPICQKKLYN